MERKSPVTVTKSLIQELIKEEEKQFTESLNNGAHSRIFEHAEVIERGIIRTRLNGYDTPDPYGKKAAMIETTFFMSFVSRDILQAVRKSVHKHFNYRNLTASSFPLVAFKAISGANPDLDDFLLVDVRGEITDVSLIKDGALLESITFPLGKTGLIRAVSDSLNISVHVAHTYVEMVLYKKATPELEAKISPVFDAYSKQWYAQFKEAIDEITKNVAIPKRLFLISDLDVEFYFQNILAGVEVGYDVHPLKRHELRSFIEMSTKYDDPFLALDALYVQNLMAHSE